jgi:hypothetical protein
MSPGIFSIRLAAANDRKSIRPEEVDDRVMSPSVYRVAI